MIGVDFQDGHGQHIFQDRVFLRVLGVARVVGDSTSDDAGHSSRCLVSRKILAVRNAHRFAWSLPGGYLREEEQLRVQAARELKDETGLVAQPYQLVMAQRVTHLFESRTETIVFFEIEYESKPALAVDRKEVLQAKFFEPQELLNKNLTPHLRDYLQGRLASGNELARSP